jgi:uncharacterized protein involved in outer membrane biogenesis
MRRLIRWAFYLLILAIVLVVAGVLLLDTIAKEVLESRIRAETGMDVKIGRLTIGLMTPTVTIEDLRLYNTAEFGGSPFINMPELHMEYDPDAIRSGKLHFKLVRLNLAEVVIVQDKKGHMNIQSVQQIGPKAKREVKTQVGSFEFTGIDTLNLTIKKCRITILDSPSREEDVNFGINNQVFHNIKSEADLTGVGILLAARTGMLSSGGSDAGTQGLLKQLMGQH